MKINVLSYMYRKHTSTEQAHVTDVIKTNIITVKGEYSYENYRNCKKIR